VCPIPIAETAMQRSTEWRARCNGANARCQCATCCLKMVALVRKLCKHSNRSGLPSCLPLPDNDEGILSCACAIRYSYALAFTMALRCGPA
jgi:hypothetical protein